MKVKELRAKLRIEYDDYDVAIISGGKRENVLYAKKENYPLRDSKFTDKIFVIVCRKD